MPLIRQGPAGAVRARRPGESGRLNLGCCRGAPIPGAQQPPAGGSGPPAAHAWPPVLAGNGAPAPGTTRPDPGVTIVCYVLPQIFELFRGEAHISEDSG